MQKDTTFKEDYFPAKEDGFYLSTKLKGATAVKEVSLIRFIVLSQYREFIFSPVSGNLVQVPLSRASGKP